MTAAPLDLTDCEREPVHIPGGVQPHAAFLAIDPATGTFCAASESFLRLTGLGVEALRETAAPAVFDAASAARLRGLLDGGLSPRPQPLRLAAGTPLNALAYHADGLLMLDLEPLDPAEIARTDAAMLDAEAAMRALWDAPDLDALRAAMVEAVADATGFDRVMLYAFDAEWNGTVVAETRAPAARDSFLGLKFPSSDIPAQARALFLRNRVRQIVDVDAEPSPILPDRHPVHGGPLDLSDSQVRAVSPIHLRYLRNMGVRASLVIALIRNGALFGLLACHHYRGPYALPARLRALCGLLCESFSAQIARHEEAALAAHRRDVAARLEPLTARAAAVARASRGAGFQTFIASAAPILLDVAGADALWLSVGEETATLGDAPPPERLADLVCAAHGLADPTVDTVVSTDNVARLGLAPQRGSAGFAYLANDGEHGGALAIRSERRSVETWAGDPDKRVTASEDGARLSPRDSFEAWRTEREGRSEPWTEIDHAAIRMIAERLPRWRLAFELARREALIASLEASRAETRRLALVAERASDAVMITDAETRIVWTNAGFTRLSGYTLDEVRGRRPGATLQGPMTDPGEVARLGASIAKAEPVRSTLLNYAKDGQPYWIDIEIMPILDAEGRPEQFISVARDVTEARAYAEALETARTAADDANAAKSTFLATMSHEVRTPMNGVIGMADLLHSRLDDPESRRMAEVIRSSGRALLTILNDVLDFSKIEAGRLELEIAPFSPADILRQVESLHRPRAEEKGLRLIVEGDGPCDRLRAGDEHRILQVLHNLVSNSLKFTDAGAVTVRFACEDDAAIAIAVADEGCGMTEAQAAKAFEPFAQAEAATARRHGGTGLGLSIVRRLVEMMSGAVDLRTAQGAGTTVSIRLPAPLAERSGAPAPARDRPLPPGLTAVAADDNEINRTVLEALLTMLGVSARIAEDGDGAIALAEAAAPDVLLLDISMPGKDGVETLAAIRAMEARLGRDASPAIAVTANAMRHQIAAYREAGFVAHAAKPLSVDSLMAALSEALAGAA
jgi:PAS domain S-box-containing protein